VTSEHNRARAAVHYFKDHSDRFVGTGSWEPPPGSVHLVFGPKAVTRMGPNVEIVAKKAALYGTHSYFVTPYKATRILLDDNPDSMGMVTTFFSASEEFEKILEQLLPYVVDGCIDVSVLGCIWRRKRRRL
jgi:hypothetical protein